MSQPQCLQGLEKNAETSSCSQLANSSRHPSLVIGAGHELVVAASPKPSCTTQSSWSSTGLTLLDNFRTGHSPETYMIEQRQPATADMALPATLDRNLGQQDPEQVDGQLPSPAYAFWASPCAASCSGDEFDNYLVADRNSGLSYTTSPGQPPACQWSSSQSCRFSNVGWGSPAGQESSHFPSTHFYAAICPDGLPYGTQTAVPPDPSGFGSMMHAADCDPPRNDSLNEQLSGNYQYPPPPQYQSQPYPSAYSDSFAGEPLSPCSTSLKFKLEDHGELSPAAQSEPHEESTAIGRHKGAGGGKGSSIVAAAGAAKTDEPYAQLIWRAFKSNPDHAMSLQELYQWFRDNTDKPKTSDGKGWQNSIRHNLSMNKAFAKKDLKDTRVLGGFHGDRNGASGSAKKSTVWILEPWAIPGVHSTTRYRKANASRRGGSSGTRPPASSKAHEPTASGRATSGRKGGITASKTKAASRAAAALTSRVQQHHHRHQNHHVRSPPPLSPLSPSPVFNVAAMGYASPVADYYTSQPASRSASTFVTSRSGTVESTNSPFIKPETGFDETSTPPTPGDPSSASPGLEIVMNDPRAPPMYYYHQLRQQQQQQYQQQHQQSPCQAWEIAGAPASAVGAGVSRFGNYGYSFSNMAGMYDELPGSQGESAIFVADGCGVVGMGCGPLRQWGQEQEGYPLHQEEQRQEQRQHLKEEEEVVRENEVSCGTRPESMDC